MNLNFLGVEIGVRVKTRLELKSLQIIFHLTCTPEIKMILILGHPEDFFLKIASFFFIFTQLNTLK